MSESFPSSLTSLVSFPTGARSIRAQRPLYHVPLFASFVDATLLKFIGWRLVDSLRVMQPSERCVGELKTGMAAGLRKAKRSRPPAGGPLRHHCVITIAVDNERWRLHLRQEWSNVDVVVALHEPRRVFRRG